MDTESVAQRARAFVEENEVLVEDPETSEHVLAAIINQGADIAVALGKEYEAAVNKAVLSAGELRDAQDAVNRGTLTPRGLGWSERRHRPLMARADEAEANLNRFMAFVEKAQERYRAKTEENEGEPDGFGELTERVPWNYGVSETTEERPSQRRHRAEVDEEAPDRLDEPIDWSEELAKFEGSDEPPNAARIWNPSRWRRWFGG